MKLKVQSICTEIKLCLSKALPDYVRESQVPGVQDAATSSGHDFDEPRNQEEATGDSLQ